MSANPHNTRPFSVSPSPRINRRGDGECVDFRPAADTPAGTVVLFAKGIGVTALDIPAGAQGALHLDGEWDFPKVSDTVFAFGDALAWDASVTAADGSKGALVAAKGSTLHAVCSNPDGAPAGTAIVRGRLA